MILVYEGHHGEYTFSRAIEKIPGFKREEILKTVACKYSSISSTRTIRTGYRPSTRSLWPKPTPLARMVWRNLYIILPAN
jgi:hypothetical protein